MKKIIIFFLEIFNFFVFQIDAQEQPAYFSFSESYNRIIDYKKGVDLEQIQDFSNIKNRKKVKRIVITVNNSEGQQQFEFYFMNGFVITEISYVHDLNKSINEYDECNRLTKEAEDFTYKYISNNCRECYYLGNKRCIEEVFEDRSILKIIKKKFTIALDTNEVIEDGRSEEEFFYDQNNNLVHYIENNWNFKGIKSKFSKDVRFYYDDNNKIQKIVSGYIVSELESDIRTITDIFYNSLNLIEKIVVKDIVSDFKYSIEFSDYDIYGNWHKSQTIRDNQITETVIREIYYMQ